MLTREQVRQIVDESVRFLEEWYSKHPLKCYFAHPMSMYGKPKELAIIKRLKEIYREVLNPGEEKYQIEYKERMRLNPGEHPMKYWLDDLAGTCDCCVFSPFPSNCRDYLEIDSDLPLVGSGVRKEVKRFLVQGKPVSSVSPDFNNEEEIVVVPFKDWNGFRCLTVKETMTLLTALGIEF